jgi:hypothetical protein
MSQGSHFKISSTLEHFTGTYEIPWMNYLVKIDTKNVSKSNYYGMLKKLGWKLSSVLRLAPLIPAGMEPFHWIPLESAGMTPESAGMALESAGMAPESAGMAPESIGMN